MDAFQAGVTATLRSWSALRAAVEQEWGGIESKRKADDLRQNIYAVMDGTGPPKITLEEMEDNLAMYLSEEFSVGVEDNSDRQVASVIFRMYEECMRGDTAFAHQVVAAAGTILATQMQVSVQNDDDDDDEDENMELVTVDENIPQSEGVLISAMDYASQSLFDQGTPKQAPTIAAPVRQLGQTAPENPPEQVDDDGFATVSTRRRR
mmetsp:Transcript_34514/g.52974  ORF Transcript_34514/g.52974 Transcript_34514/m.52974 type:complete len:207 (+) Transcript_34514:110-730(+)